jgi:hypothetical protein
MESGQVAEYQRIWCLIQGAATALGAGIEIEMIFIMPQEITGQPNWGNSHHLAPTQHIAAHVRVQFSVDRIIPLLRRDTKTLASRVHAMNGYVFKHAIAERIRGAERFDGVLC